MKILNSKKGFTLIEALVAISILMVAVAAPITIAQKGLSSAVYSKDQMIASYLAQDAIEYIKNLRDNYTINNYYDWDGLDFISECLVDDNNEYGCQLDTVTQVVEGAIISGSSLRKIEKDANGLYTYDGGTETKFTRIAKVQIDPESNNDDNRALITVTVDWNDNLSDGENQVTVRALIFNY